VIALTLEQAERHGLERLPAEALAEAPSLIVTGMVLLPGVIVLIGIDGTPLVLKTILYICSTSGDEGCGTPTIAFELT